MEAELFLLRFVLLPVFFIIFVAFYDHIVAVIVEGGFYLVGLAVLAFIQQLVVPVFESLFAGIVRGLPALPFVFLKGFL